VASATPLAYNGEVPKELEKGFFVGPTIFDGVQNSMTIAREEIFGPVLSVLTFKEEKFSSDRTIAQYAAEIWNVKPCPVP
jgi:acyl-CoA reductase-like NAD-dependent aldehyde dehydrogenase